MNINSYQNVKNHHHQSIILHKNVMFFSYKTCSCNTILANQGFWIEKVFNDDTFVVTVIGAED